ncbi:hypothetical protein VPH35_044035 [Triticum aestivum]
MTCASSMASLLAAMDARVELAATPRRQGRRALQPAGLPPLLRHLQPPRRGLSELCPRRRLRPPSIHPSIHAQSSAALAGASAKVASANRSASAPPPARASSCLVLVPAPLVAGNQQEKPRLRSRTRAIHCCLLRFPYAPPGPMLHSQVVIGGLVNHHPSCYLEQLLHGF